MKSSYPSSDATCNNAKFGQCMQAMVQSLNYTGKRDFYTFQTYLQHIVASNANNYINICSYCTFSLCCPRRRQFV